VSDKPKAMNITQLRQIVAEAAGITPQQAKLALDSLTNTAIEQANSVGVFNVPGLCKITKAHKPARPEKKMISPLTKQEITVKAKPAHNVVKVRAIKALKEAVV
jgi:nucleoid DNA-binding protein